MNWSLPLILNKLKIYIPIFLILLICIPTLSCNNQQTQSMYTDNSNKDSLAIELNHIETDSTFEYDLIVNKNKIKNFRLKKDQIKTYPRLRIKNKSDSFLFKIFDYIYIASENKVYILMDEWGKVKLYSFHFDPSKKEIGKIKNEEKWIFTYKIRRMDADLFQANNICLRYYDRNLILMVSPPHPSPGLIFIKIPLDEYQRPTKLILKESERFESEKFDPIIYTASENFDTINMILKDRIRYTLYKDASFKISFVMDDDKTQKTYDDKGRILYINQRYFFCTTNTEKLVVKYENLNWIFYKYEEIPIESNELINVSSSQ